MPRNPLARGTLPTLVPTSPRLIPDCLIPLSSPPFPARVSLLAAPRPLQSQNKKQPPYLLEAQLRSHHCLEAFLSAPGPNLLKKHFPATLPTSQNLFSTQTKQQTMIMSIILYGTPGIFHPLLQLSLSHCHCLTQVYVLLTSHSFHLPAM